MKGVEDLLVLKGVNDEIEESHLESEQMLLKELESNQNYINQLRIRFVINMIVYLIIIALDMNVKKRNTLIIKEQSTTTETWLIS